MGLAIRGVARLAAAVVAGGVLLAVTLALLVPDIGAVLSAHTSQPVPIDLDPLAQRSVVVAADGATMLGVLYGGENRKVVPFADVPAVLVATVLAVEDANFYRHGGIDVRSMVRALFTNLEAGVVKEGGSTITQQLVKNALLAPKQDLNRKLKEAVLSIRLEHQLSKQQILERYLNTVYFGNGAYGVQAAAETYFGKDGKTLDAADSALLAGLIQNPLGADPFRHAEAARGRRAEVVTRLRTVGAVDDAAAAAILAAPLPTQPSSILPKPDDYFVNEVVQQLIQDRRLGATPTARYNAVFKGGLTVTTTLDAHDQRLAAAAVRDTLPDSGGKFTAALVSVEPSSGAVRALVGGPGFERSKFNIATQGVGRQVGSAMKPFVLAAAIDSGISPTSTILGSSPCSFPNPTGTPNPYKAENFDGEEFGVQSLYDATRHSVNCAYLRLGQVVGLSHVVTMAHRLGITAHLDANLSLPLGTSEIRPIDMASAYATFATSGIYHRPYLVEEIRDRNGKVIEAHGEESRRVLDGEVANEVTDVLKGVITGGTGTAARFPDRRPAAGKTGTTNDHSDAWFVGYTRQLSTAVWMGSPVGRLEMRNLGGVAGVTGGTFPARIWQAFMGPAHDGLAMEDFPAPAALGRGTYLRAPGEQVVVASTTTSTTTPTTTPTTTEGPPGEGRKQP